MRKNHKGNKMTVTGHNVAFLVILCLFKSGCLPVIQDRWGGFVHVSAPVSIVS